MSSYGSAKSALGRGYLQSMWYANLVVESCRPIAWRQGFRSRISGHECGRKSLRENSSRDLPRVRGRSQYRFARFLWNEPACVSPHHSREHSSPPVNTNSGLIAVMRHSSARAKLLARFAVPFPTGYENGACRGVSNWPRQARPPAAASCRHQ